MTILYISSSRVPSRAANSVHVMKMCHAFSEHGHKVHLVTAKVRSDLEKNISDIFSFYGVTNNFRFYRLPWLEVPNFAVIYAFQILLLFLYLTIKNNFKRPLCYSRFVMGSYFVSFFAKEIILEMHSTVGRQKSEQFMFRQLINKSNFKHLVVISNSLANALQGTYPSLRNKIVVAHDGADIVPLNKKIDLNANPTVQIVQLGYVGHLYQGRGIDMMISLVKDNPSLHLHLVGGTENDIQSLRKKISYIPNITIHGFLPPSETSAFRNSVDILLAPYEKKVSVYGSSLDTSRWMSPLKIFEYMSAKKPIICSELPVLQEVLTHEKNALLCNPESLDEWKKAISRLISNPSFAKEISERAYADFLEHYTWKNRASNVLK